jgi:hypothetical protein
MGRELVCKCMYPTRIRPYANIYWKLPLVGSMPLRFFLTTRQAQRASSGDEAQPHTSHGPADMRQYPGLTRKKRR